MSFAQILREVTSSDASSQNVLTDGRFSCKYFEASNLLIKVDEALNKLGIDSSACVTLECGNSLASALVLLALMRRGISFLLLPLTSNGNDWKPTPHFCRYRLTVGTEATSGVVLPEFSFHAEPNHNYNGRAAEPERVYLRTSGSMGESKIVVHTYASLLGNARNCVEKYGFTPESRAVIPVPIAHMYGFGAEFLPAIMAGASIDLQEKTNVLKYLDREKRFGPTIAFVTPSICDMLLKGFKTPRSSYEVIVTSGQRMREDLFRAFDALVSGRLINQYGSTEMGATAACNRSDSVGRRAVSVGEPMKGVRLRIANLQESADEIGTGELCCQHPFGFAGYLDENGDWLHRHAADGWFATHDLAATEPDGSFRILGRADASVNRSGYLVLLADIERTIEKLKAIEQVAVIPTNGESKHGQRIAAFCVQQADAGLSESRIREFCFELLPSYAIPDEVHILDALPLLASGKLDRQILATLVK